MGRYAWSTRTLVEESLVLDISWLRKKGFLAGFRTGMLSWTDSFNDHKDTIAIEVSVHDLVPPDGYARLQYTTTHGFSGEKKENDYKITVDATSCNYGGYRFWFICPLVAGGRSCNGRVGKLYLPPGGYYFGCRKCYDLTYRCQREHDSRVDALLKNPGLFEQKLKSGNPLDSLVTAKAYVKLFGSP